MADNMADDRTEGTQEMAGEQVVPTRQAAGTPPPSSLVVTGVDLDTIIRLLSQTRETMERQAVQATEERAQQAAQQLQATSELKYTLKAELDAMETRVRDYTNDVCARVKWEIKMEVEEPLQAMKHQLAAVTRDVEAYRQMMAEVLTASTLSVTLFQAAFFTLLVTIDENEPSLTLCLFCTSSTIACSSSLEKLGRRFSPDLLRPPLFMF